MSPKHEFSQYLSELIGTFFLVFFGCGSIVLADLGNSSIGPFIPVVFGGAVSVMIYATGHISGAHFNPAVTIAFWWCRKFPRKRVPGYILAQILGATLASLYHFYVWGGDHSFGVTAIKVAPMVAFSVEAVLSFALMFVIMSVATDSRAVGELAGIAIGTTVAMCAFIGGPLTSASMNPARSLGPAFISGELNNIWIYLVAPILGALLGALTYDWIRCANSENSNGHGCC